MGGPFPRKYEGIPRLLVEFVEQEEPLRQRVDRLVGDPPPQFWRGRAYQDRVRQAITAIEHEATALSMFAARLAQDDRSDWTEDMRQDAVQLAGYMDEVVRVTDEVLPALRVLDATIDEIRMIERTFRLIEKGPEPARPAPRPVAPETCAGGCGRPRHFGQWCKRCCPDDERPRGKA